MYAKIVCFLFNLQNNINNYKFHQAGKKVVVILNIGGALETASWKDKPDAILLSWQGGEESGNSVADLLTGEANPSGRLAVTFPIKLDDVPSHYNLPCEETRTTTNYPEDIYVGYRYFDSFNKPVSYPFGYGLSYTSFKFSNAKISSAKNGFKAKVTVTNTGKVKGKEVVQLYVAAPNSQAENKPSKELRAFAKTSELAPGQSETITMTVNDADLASFDESRSAWETEKGIYKVLIGASIQDIRATLQYTVKKPIERKVGDLLHLNAPLQTLKR